MGIPQIIGGRFEIGDPERDLLGRGGMGDVYRARDLHTGELSAVKALRPEVVAGTPDAIARFIREGEALRELNHPNIVKMVDAVAEGGRHYLVMEYVPGGSLRDLLEMHGPLPLERTVEIALEVADALTRAHHLGIIHRDLKPSNVLMAKDGTPRLTDFGIAQLASGPRLTAPDRGVGTVDYMSPEACNIEPLDRRTDIWSFGVMLYEMLAGERPFAGDSPLATLTAILTRPLPDLQRLCPDAPDALADLVYRMLEKDRSARIPSVRLVGAELEAILGAVSGQQSAVSGRGAAVSSQQPASAVSSVVYRPLSSITSRFVTPTPPAERPRHNLPAQTAPFIGRERELEALARLLADPEVRLVTVLGPGGMGKTRLALEAAQAQIDRQPIQFPDGVYLASMAPLRSAEHILSTVAEAVRFQFYPGGDPERQFLDYLREKRMLLVMDNYEHLLDGVGMVSEILRAAPGARVLATSREKLNLSGETTFLIGGMEHPDWETPEDALEHSAIRLFIQSARRTRPGYELRVDDLKYVVRICRLVGGMPLGILLAAAWMDLLSPEEIAVEIERSLDFLETEARDLPAEGALGDASGRHRSLRAVFESSWHRLSEAERDAFARLSVFRGGFTREAAQAVTGAGLRTLMGLTNKSLLHRSPDGRYEVHEWLRQYAEEKLSQMLGAKEKTLDLHSAYYGEFLHQREVEIWDGEQQHALAEMDNIRAAWRWAIEHGQVANAHKFLPGLRGVYVEQGWASEGEPLFQWVTDTLRVDEPVGEKGILLGLCLGVQGMFARGLGYEQKGRQLAQESLSILRASGSGFALARGSRLAFVAGLQEGSEIEQALLEGLAVDKEQNDPRSESQTLTMLGQHAWHHRRYDEAEQYLREAIKVVRHLNRGLTAWPLEILGRIAYARQEYAQASRLYKESLALASSNKWSAGNRLFDLGDVALAMGELQEAKDRYQEALADYRAIGAQRGIVLSIGKLGSVALALGDHPEAKRCYVQALSTALDKRLLELVPSVLIGPAKLCAREGNPERALELIGLALHHPGDVAETKGEAAKLLEELRVELPPEIVSEAQERGRARDLWATVEELLAELDSD